MRILLAIALALVTWSSTAAENFPEKQINVVVTFPPGGVTDAIGRLLADGLRERYDENVVVENRDGASGIVGTSYFLNLPRDGYSMMVGGFGSHLLPPLVMSDYPYDVREELVPLALVAEFVNVMIVNKDLPVETVADFVEYAKERPGELNFGSSGVAASNHLTAELFMLETGIEMVHVPYGGEGEAIGDLRAGAIDVIFSNLPSAAGHIEAGNVRALGVTSSYQVDALPDVPTIAESGNMPDFAVTSWVGIYGSAGMPDDLAEYLGNVIAEFTQEEATQEALRRINFEPVGLNSQEFSEFVDAEFERWSEVVEAAGVRQ